MHAISDVVVRDSHRGRRDAVRQDVPVERRRRDVRTSAESTQLACLGFRGDGMLFGCASNYDPDHMALGRSPTPRLAASHELRVSQRLAHVPDWHGRARHVRSDVADGQRPARRSRVGMRGGTRWDRRRSSDRCDDAESTRRLLRRWLEFGEFRRCRDPDRSTLSSQASRPHAAIERA